MGTKIIFENGSNVYEHNNSIIHNDIIQYYIIIQYKLIQVEEAWRDRDGYDRDKGRNNTGSLRARVSHALEWAVIKPLMQQGRRRRTFQQRQRKNG